MLNQYVILDNVEDVDLEHVKKIINEKYCNLASFEKLGGDNTNSKQYLVHLIEASIAHDALEDKIISLTDDKIILIYAPKPADLKIKEKKKGKFGEDDEEKEDDTEENEIPGQSNIVFLEESQNPCLNLLKIDLKNDDSIKIEPHEFCLINKHKFMKTLKMKYKSISLSYDPRIKCLNINGNEIELLMAKSDILLWTKEIVTKNHKFDDKFCNLFTIDKVINKINDKLPAAYVQYGGKNKNLIIFYLKSEPSIINMMKEIEKNLQHAKIPVNHKDIMQYILLYGLKHLNDIKKLNEEMVLVKEYDDGNNQNGFVIVMFGMEQVLDIIVDRVTKYLNSIVCRELKFKVKTNECSTVSKVIKMMESQLECVIASVNTDKNENQAYLNETKVSIREGRIENEFVDVIVNTTSEKLLLNHGPISISLSTKAGPNLQKECSTLGKLTFDTILETNGYNLQCKSVYHCLAMQWSESGTEQSVKVLNNIIMNCLKKATNKKYESISFPAICCGVLKMPTSLSATTVIKAIQNFLIETPTTSLTDIRVVITDAGQRPSALESYRTCLKNVISKNPWKVHLSYIIYDSDVPKVEQKSTKISDELKRLGIFT